MPYPFYRAEESRHTRPASSPGVRVRYRDGVTHFFPGESDVLAMYLARAATPPVLFEQAEYVEFGEKFPGGFLVKKVLRSPTGK